MANFPLELQGFSQRPEYLNHVNQSKGGAVQVISLRSQAIRRYNALAGVKTKTDADELIAFFHTMEGRLNVFTLKDIAEYTYDYTATANAGDGSTTTFQMSLVYENADGTTKRRNITKPVPGTVAVKVNDVLQTEGSDYTVNYATGVITFSSAPGSGLAVTQKCEFYVPVRFGVDGIDIEQIKYYVENGDINSLQNFADIPIVEEIQASAVIVTVDDDEAPSVPVMTSPTSVTHNSITFNWNAATDNVAVTAYTLQIATDSGFSSIVSTHTLGNVLTYQKTGLSAETQYYGRVKALDAASNESAYSSSTNDTTTAAPASTNYALASNGSTATADSRLWNESAVINGLRHTNNDWVNKSWLAENGRPNYIEIDFGQSRTIDTINVIGVADAGNYNTDPDPSDTGTSYLNEDFDLEYWNGSAWAAIPGASVTGNDLVIKTFTFTALATTKIKLNITAIQNSGSLARLVELEATG